VESVAQALAGLEAFELEVLDAWYGLLRLNGLFLDVAEPIARPAGLTAAWWQVLGAVLSRPCRSPASRARWVLRARACSGSPISSSLAAWRDTRPIRRIAAPSSSSRPKPAARPSTAAVGEAQLREALATLERVDAELTRAAIRP
jgi:hypothetical protein